MKKVITMVLFLVLLVGCTTTVIEDNNQNTLPQTSPEQISKEAPATTHTLPDAPTYIPTDLYSGEELEIITVMNKRIKAIFEDDFEGYSELAIDAQKTDGPRNFPFVILEYTKIDFQIPQVDYAGEKLPDDSKLIYTEKRGYNFEYQEIQTRKLYYHFIKVDGLWKFHTDADYLFL